MNTVDKSVSVNKYLNYKIPYYKTEMQIDLEQDKIIEKYSEMMVGTLNERIDLIISSLGLNSSKLTLYHKLILITQLVPYAEINYNLYLFGDAETSKSTTFYCYSDIPCRYTGLPSPAELRGNKIQKNTIAPLLSNNILVLEEIIDDKVSSDSLPILKEFMESGVFFKENTNKKNSPCSVVFIGNNYNNLSTFSELRKEIIFDSLPKSLKDKAFIERFNAKIFKDNKYKIEPSMLLTTKTEALNINLLINCLLTMKTTSYDFSFNFDTKSSSRDIHRTRATMSGLLKILYPSGDASPEIIRGIYNFSLHLRLNGGETFFYSPFNSESIPFILEGLGMNKTEVKSIVLIENRILIQKSGKSHWEKIALNEWGLEENLKELSFYKNNPKDIIASIDLDNSSSVKILQKYYPLYSLNCTFLPCGKLKIDDRNTSNNYDYNKQLIERIKSSALYNIPFPQESLKEWKRMSEQDLAHLINTELKLNIVNLYKSSYYYDNNYALFLINFSQYLK